MKEARQEQQESMGLGQTLSNDSGTTMSLTARAVGFIEGLDYFIEMTVEDETDGNDRKV